MATCICCPASTLLAKYHTTSMHHLFKLVSLISLCLLFWPSIMDCIPASRPLQLDLYVAYGRLPRGDEQNTSHKTSQSKNSYFLCLHCTGNYYQKRWWLYEHTALPKKHKSHASDKNAPVVEGPEKSGDQIRWVLLRFDIASLFIYNCLDRRWSWSSQETGLFL